MAPCFCRRCSRSWLLWRKCRLHFSHCRAESKGTKGQNHIGGRMHPLEEDKQHARANARPLRVLRPLHRWSGESTVGEAVGKLLNPQALTPARHSVLPQLLSPSPHAAGGCNLSHGYLEKRNLLPELRKNRKAALMHPMLATHQSISNAAASPSEWFGVFPPLGLVSIPIPEERRLITHMIRFLARVDSKVAFEGLQVPETCATDLAGVWLLPSVNEHMSTEMGHLRESSPRLGFPLSQQAGLHHHQTPVYPLHGPAATSRSSAGSWPCPTPGCCGSQSSHPPGQIWPRRSRTCRVSLRSEYVCGFSGWPAG